MNACHHAARACKFVPAGSWRADHRGDGRYLWIISLSARPNLSPPSPLLPGHFCESGRHAFGFAALLPRSPRRLPGCRIRVYLPLREKSGLGVRCVRTVRGAVHETARGREIPPAPPCIPWFKFSLIERPGSI